MSWAEVAKNAEAGERASELALAAQRDFHAALRNFDWARVEEARVSAVAAFEAYLDVMTVAYKKIEEFKRGG